MTKNKSNKKNTNADLRELLKRHGISQTIIASTIGMNLSVFKAKMYQTKPSYFFTDAEHIAILEALNIISIDIKKIIKRYTPGGTMSVSSQKYGAKSEKFREAHFQNVLKI